MTENVIGLWKQRFPILRRGIGTKIQFTCEVIVATCILHNMDLEWQEEDPDDDEESSDSDASDDEDGFGPNPDRRADIRTIGQAHRDWLCQNFC